MAEIAYPDRAAVPKDLADMLAAMPRVAPIDMLAHSPTVAQCFLWLAQAQFTTLKLPVRARELVILTVASECECEYEYRQHILASEAAGVERELRESIWEHQIDPAALSEVECALISFVTDVLRAPRVSSGRLTELQGYYSPREIVEILHLIGFYWCFGRICTVLDIEIETPTNLDAIEAVSNLSGR
jgi:alkylhydroperoxidase family enzyme